MVAGVGFNAAVNAYQRASGAVESAIAGGKAVAKPRDDGDSFSAMVTNSLQEAVKLGRNAEELSLRQIAGEADLKDVVTAVANAEHTLESVVAVRDKVLSAYQEILRMPI
jgi:flagellar hook-basal body complex protein FliE